MAGLYLHTPFCRRKCHYCDFFSAPPAANQLEGWHLLLQSQLRLLGSRPARRLETIFFGGGTPSLLTPEQIGSLLETCRTVFNLDADAEISLEANPADLNLDKLFGYRAAGINRLSIGIQSFSDQQLQQLGRRHTAQEGIAAFQAARRAGFKNLSVDLIFALPGQGLSALKDEIDQLLKLNPEHVGIYGLSIEDGTPLARQAEQGLLKLPDDEEYAQAYLQISKSLQDAGYEHYEISNFARSGWRCRHNQAYWQRKSCLAAGCGAHGFDAEGDGRRYEIPADLGRFERLLANGTDPAVEIERFTPQQAMAETIYLGLRTRDGIDCNAFARRFGRRPEEAYPQALTQLAPHLRENAGRWQMDPSGWLLYDHLIGHFLSV